MACIICMEDEADKLQTHTTQKDVEEMQRKIVACIPDFTLPLEMDGSHIEINVCIQCSANMDIVLPFISFCHDTAKNWKYLVKHEDKDTLKELCRLCTRHVPDLRKIYSSEKGSVNLEDRINACIHPLKVSEKDTLPLNICADCLEPVLLSSDLRVRHWRTSKLRRVTSCPKCEKTFEDEDALKRHRTCTRGYRAKYVTASNRDELRTCEQCHAEVRNANFKRHMCATVYCKLCDNYFLKRNNLKNHYLKCHNKYLCTTQRCFLYFDQQLEVRDHCISVHKKVYLIRTLCDLCGAEVQKNKMQDHIYYVHDKKENKFKCEHCTNSYKTKNLIFSHMKRHLNIRGYACKLCPKKYFAPEHLKTHIISKHSDKKFVCKECGRQFNTKLNLNMHVDGVHNDTWFYHCAICNVGFPSEEDVEAHFNLHSIHEKFDVKEKFYKTSEFQCEICFTYLKNRTKFVFHLREKHKVNQKQYNEMDLAAKARLRVEGTRDVKPNKCTFCYQVFLSIKSLNAHLKVNHANINFTSKNVKTRWFTCHACDLVFHKKSQLKHHVILKHLVPPK